MVARVIVMSRVYSQPAIVDKYVLFKSVAMTTNFVYDVASKHVSSLQ